MPGFKHNYTLFLSHSWRYGGDYDQLLRLLKTAPDFNWRNTSRPQCNPGIDPESAAWARELILALHGQIKPADCVLLISGLYRATPWIQIAINVANYYRKPMVGLLPRYGQMPAQPVQAAVKEMVDWEAREIVEAVKRNAV